MAYYCPCENTGLFIDPKCRCSLVSNNMCKTHDDCKNNAGLPYCVYGVSTFGDYNTCRESNFGCLGEGQSAPRTQTQNPQNQTQTQNKANVCMTADSILNSDTALNQGDHYVLV